MVNVPVAARPPSVHHTPRLLPTWFAGGADEGMSLHRYLDDQFVPRFLQDAQAGRLTATRSQGWYQSDRVGRYKDAPLLRLPMHRAFYIACCEVSCDTFGLPAFDPVKVRSAGFVVRRGLPGGAVQRWMIREGEALGWQGGAGDGGEPDEYRRLLHHGLLKPRFPEPPYSGEETHPLHPALVKARDASGHVRNRTLLWGYLPLGGTYREQGGVEIPTDTDTALGQEIAWPCGSRGARAWQAQDSRPVQLGYASQGFRELLSVLLRYRITDATQPDNEALRALLGQIHFYPAPSDRFAAPPPTTRGTSLLEWLDRSEAAVLDWLTRLAAGSATLTSAPLPSQSGLDAAGKPLSVPVVLDVYLSQTQAALLRQLVPARGRRAMARNDDGIAFPRYPQGEDDLFHAVPFVRWEDDCGCERTVWGRPSLPFRVASPLDPDFQRPQAILLPRLDDLKRGAARGIALMAPKSLADKLLGIAPKMPPAEGGPGNACGLCWVFSLSIPIVTICAMIILMILINLLNLIFGWLPWALLALPRLCGKLLKD
ncbi:MAG TPA: hypothetical protein PLN96_05880 [Zoogloea sp.]|uniref:hypothetical protein n=1 Tax=Zoogloea sp. TaxID=49181 RepID=UPI002BFB4F35|nr:hypothetical protein [Zoogloea sp.]HMV62586.1 hypothetical protein [Rhodocyclaceae bacterium]HNB64464.1 hypothetical protein [Rhodocyclaceae bacterium]HNI47369.1 hypothetical protein [Zoogloea sp.]